MFQELKKHNKAGVSLITVLLFMMVATIAATATYKWITSEGRSSSSRMLQREAYQSAVAGIESARSWMMYHANETGALIKQYKDGNNAPIKLNNMLAEFVKAGQSYDVWLVGANTENATYKLKLMATGKARNGTAVHSEIAIINVNGLYQVKIPTETITAETDFKYAYFGGTITYEGSSDVSAVVVNGEWEKNPPRTTEGDFIVTGKADLSGNSIDVKGTGCFGDSLIADNGISAENLYVVGNITGTALSMNIRSDAYIEKKLSQKNQPITIGGSLTVGEDGLIITNAQSTTFTLGKNLCIENGGQIQKTNFTEKREFVVPGDVWIPGKNAFYTGQTSEDNYAHIVLGNSTESNVYIAGVLSAEEYQKMKTGSKKFVEDDSYKKLCDPAKQISSGDIWSIRSQNGGDDNKKYSSSEKDICGSWDTPNWHEDPWWESSDSYYRVKYTRGWTNWKGDSYEPYREKVDNPVSDMYVFYDNNVEDVNFGEKDFSNWKHFKSIDDNIKLAYTSVGPFYPDYYNFTPKNDEISNKFISPTPLGVYSVGGKIFYDLNTHNEYNYENGIIKGSPYCKKGENKYRPECFVTPWFKSKAKKIETNLPTSKPNTLVCAENVKDYCNDIWEYTPGNGCPNRDGTKSNYTVKDQIKTGYSHFISYANKAPCIQEIVNLDDNAKQNFFTNNGAGKLNQCYTDAKTHDEENDDEKYMYNDYLVIHLQNDILFKGSSSTGLSGKYIFIVDEKTEFINLPHTATENDFVMLYLPNGYSGEIKPGNAEERYNYFIYSEGDINKVLSFKNFHGTIYAKAENCSKVNSLHSSTITLNEDLINDMALNGLVCDAKVSSCGGTGGTTGSGSTSGSATSSITFGGTDNHYISVAPQLSITLETQYENNEKIDVENSANTEGSFIVLPRVLYLTKDAVGKLENYYNVVTLNNTTPASVSNVSCTSVQSGSSGNIPTTGKLTEGGELSEGYYKCNVTGSVGNKQQNVPFWVIVKGEGASSPSVSFIESNVEVAIGSETNVSLTWDKTTGASLQCEVTVSVSDYGSDWQITPQTGVTQSGSDYVVSFNTSQEPAKQILNVGNVNSSDGSIVFMITNATGCQPSSPSVEVVYNANSIKVNRKGLSEYCTGPGAGTDNCNVGGKYKEWINRPDCEISSSEIWVDVNGQNCSATSINNQWSCGINGGVSLTEIGSHIGCEVIIPTENNSATGPFTADEEIILYGDIKAVQQTFNVGFSVEGDLDNSQAIRIDVSGPGDYSASKTCTYGNFKNDVERTQYCSIPVYRGSTVSLSLSPENPNEFNYWQCESGSTDCSSSETFTGQPYEINVTGENTIYAHFGENDKHCFFDEFKEGSGNIRYNRTTIECSGDNIYCIDDCDGTCENATAEGNSKWKLIFGAISDLDYSDGKIALKASATRGKKESEKINAKAVIMSSVLAGKDGELKVQFQVPQVEGSGELASTTVKNSGFILRSNSTNTSYLMLNLFTNKTNNLIARVCLNGESTCLEKQITNNVLPTDIILMSASLNSNKLNIEVWPNSWSNDSKSVEFELANNHLNGVEATSSNEYVGYSLAHPNFKIYGIGWKSSTYGSECWDTYPTISCSFKVAYTGGIVPQNDSVKPWTGLSAWYSGKTCTVDYYYNGDDACGGTGSNYTSCGGAYSFAERGIHGYTEDGIEKKTAKVTTNNCDVYGEEAAWATKGVAAHCGNFWVGNLNPCSKNFTFEHTTNSDEGEYYGLASGSANLREAELKVSLENPNAGEVEIYLFSKNEEAGYSYDNDYKYSLPYKTKSAGTLSISIENLSNLEGFDPEHIIGVYIKTFNDALIKINSIVSSCPNVISIEECSANYNASAKRWEIGTTINNYPHTAKIDVIEKNSRIIENAPSCNYPTSDPICSFSNINGNKGKNILNWIDNPYTNNGDLSYNFTITLTTDESEIIECETESSLSGISASCGSLSKSTVAPGKGLPTFSYSLSNCPDNQCKYKILLSSGETIKEITTTGNGNWTTSGNELNGNENALEEGSYKFVLSNENPERAFTGCESAEFIVAKSTEDIVTGNCSFENANVLAGSSANFKIDNTGDNSKWDKRDSNTVSAILSGEGVSQSITINRYYTAPISILAPSKAGSYTYTISYDDNTFCTATLNVSVAGDVLQGNCPTITTYPSVWTTWTGVSVSGYQSLSGNVKLKASVDGKESSIDCKSSECNIASQGVNAPSTIGSYTYSLTADGIEECTGSYEVISPLSCSVDKTTIGLGESFKFTANYPGNCYNTTFTGSGVSHNNCQMSYEITPTAIGTHTYTFKVTGGSLDVAECTQTIIVEEIAPTITCPADLTGIALNTTISVTPQSLTGCTNGCNYTIYETSATGSGYTGGEVSFTGESAAGEKTYTWNVSNSKGSDDCEFKVTYEEGGSVVPTCNCTCPTGCDNVITTGWNSSNTSGCYFATAISFVGPYNNSVVNVNGKEFSNNYFGSGFPDPIDGGYYIQFTIADHVAASFTSGSPLCSGSGGGGSGTDPDPGAGGGNIINVTSTATSISAGTHKITCSGGGQLICWRSGDEFTFKLNDADCKAFAGEAWGSCGGGTCNSSEQTIVTEKDIQCKGGW